MNILFLNAYFFPENIAFTHVEKDLLDALVGRGHRIDVVSPTPTRGITPETAQAYRDTRYEELYGGQVRVRRFWAPREKNNPVIRALRYFWCNVREYVVARRLKETDVIFACSTPPTQGLLAGMLKRKLKCGYVYSLQDVFPDSLVSSGMTRAGSALFKTGRWIEDRTYRGADRIVVISDDFRKNILKKGVSAAKVEVIYNWVNTGAVTPVPRDRNNLFDRYHLDRSKFYVCYSGNIGLTQDMDRLLCVAKEIARVQPNIHFVIVGDGADRDRVENRVRGEGIENVTLLPFQPYEEISCVFSLGDVGLIMSKQGIGGSSVPSKTWSVMAAARPVLASFDLESELCRIVTESGCGACVQAGDHAAFTSEVLRFYERREALASMGERGRAYVLHEKLRETSLIEYVRALEETGYIGRREKNRS